MAYLRWNGSDWYVFAHASEDGLAIWTRFGERPDLGDSAEGRERTPVYPAGQVEDFLIGVTPMSEIPGWLQTSQGERERLILAMHEYLVEENQPQVLEENLIRRMVHRESTPSTLQAVWNAIQEALEPDEDEVDLPPLAPRCGKERIGLKCGRPTGHEGSHAFCIPPPSGVLSGKRCRVFTLNGKRCTLRLEHGSAHLDEDDIARLHQRAAAIREGER